jgi:hypothetical protein
MTKSVAVVTGASQGIGRATAPRLARDFLALVPRLLSSTLIWPYCLQPGSWLTRRYRSSAGSMRC